MALQNIGASNKNDAFYRYKMPKMVTKIEGKGNGIKTNVVNMAAIAKALARPASYISKYFCCELGTSYKFDERSGSSVINGEHKASRLAELLESFIQKYVQCYGCGNPETKIVVNKAQLIHLKCAACGFVSEVVDIKDRLQSFIAKDVAVNQKAAVKGKNAAKAAVKGKNAAKEQGRESETKKQNQGASTKKKRNESDKNCAPVCIEGARDDEQDKIVWQTDASLEAAQKRMQEQLNAVTFNLVV